jgi:hypothetical protein
LLLVTETGWDVGVVSVVVTGFAAVVVEPRMLVIVFVELVRIVVAEGLTIEVGVVDPVALAMELTRVEGATAEITELSVPETELKGAVAVFTTGKDDTAAVSESTVAGMELTVVVTEFRTGAVIALVSESNAEGSVATVPVIVLTAGSDVSVFRVAGTLAVIEPTTGGEVTVFVTLSSIAGTVPTTLSTVEPTTEVGVVRRVPRTGVDVVVAAMAVVADAGSAIA